MLAGRLDSATAGELEERINAELTPETGELTIDLREVDFISSKGLRVLVAAYHMLESKKVTLIDANASIQEVLRLSGLLKIFTVK